jgi:hypothetical protein
MKISKNRRKENIEEGNSKKSKRGRPKMLARGFIRNL